VIGIGRVPHAEEESEREDDEEIGHQPRRPAREESGRRAASTILRDTLMTVKATDASPTQASSARIPRSAGVRAALSILRTWAWRERLRMAM
jgi:hypothetical protein